MKQIVLKRIKLTNWKTKNLDVTFGNNVTKVSAENEVGKSSLQQAWNWLLSAYTSAVYPKNHELFDNRVELSPETPVASVKAWLEINGLEFSIEKTAQAKFSRKRGSNEWVKDASDTYKMFIDEIETSTTDFNGWIEQNICPTDMLVYCLDGSFFSVLAEDDKKKARKVLEQIVGDITINDFTGDYSILANDFAKGYTIEQIEERTKHQTKPIKDRMDKIPALIEDKERLVGEFEKNDYDSIERQIVNTKEAIEKIDSDILGLGESIKPILGERNRILDIINSKAISLQEQKKGYMETFNAFRNELNGKIKGVAQRNLIIQNRNEQKKCNYNLDCKNLERFNAELTSLEEYRKELATRRDEIKARVFTDDKCAYCGQELPIEELEKAKEKFNTIKQKELEAIVVLGKNTKQKIDDLKIRISELQVIIDKGVDEEPMEDATEYENKLAEIERNFVPFEQTENANKLKNEIDALKDSMPELPNNDNDVLLSTKKTLLSALESLNRQLGGKDKAKEIKDEITALKCELKDLGIEIARLEGILALCKEYVEERADIISNRINTQLIGCKIRMYETQKNGDIVPSCTIVSDKGVKFATQSNSARIKANIAIQQMFLKHYDVALPVFVDECSVFSTNNLPKSDNQMIYLFASDSATLQVEIVK